MKLLLTVCLTLALVYTVEPLQCQVCNNSDCSNSSSTECPSTSVVCKTVTSVIGIGSSVTVKVNKNCSTLTSCLTPISLETEWSVNLGYTRQAHNQLCCLTDNCNLATLATPSLLTNGKVCNACASVADSLAGTCNTTVSCLGAEDKCFSSNSTVIESNLAQLGCMSQNLCDTGLLTALFSLDIHITCGAPWSTKISFVLLPLGLTAYKGLV